MPEIPETHEAAAANRMYWESDDSVADIAARFDFSRRALYDAVRPHPTGVPCAECGGELAFENRLARKSGSAQCLECGAVQEGIEALDAAPDARQRSRPSAFESERSREDARSGDLRQRAVLLSGAAIAGIAIGGVATWLARRRD